MKNKNIIIVIILFMLIISCVSSKHYRGCDGKKKFKTQMQY